MASLSHEPQVDYVPTQAETDWLRLLGDTGIDLDREAALLRYALHFGLDDGELDRLRMLRQFIQGAAIAASAAGLIPHRITFPGGVASPGPGGIGATGMAL